MKVVEDYHFMRGGERLKVFDVFIKSGIKIPDMPILTDRAFKITCPTCGKEQTLDRCTVSKRVDVTFYTCQRSCTKDLVTVYKFGTRENQEGHAYRLKDYVIKSANDLYIVRTDGSKIQFPG
jgi:predicted RNA-binding Zn-ribbon protein involved in translation (DUF1610 family)